MMAQDDIVNKLFEMAGDLPIKAPDHKYVAWMSKRLDAALARAEAAERRVAELEAQLSAWENIQRGAIERQEDIPWEALLVNFREPTVTERHYGDTLISLLEDSIEGQ